MKKLLFLLTTPFGLRNDRVFRHGFNYYFFFKSEKNEEKKKESNLLDTGIQPFVPPGLALLWGFANQEGGNARPLVLSIFHNCRLEDFILSVLPNST
jgi:hypothetical protein